MGVGVQLDGEGDDQLAALPSAGAVLPGDHVFISGIVKAGDVDGAVGSVNLNSAGIKSGILDPYRLSATTASFPNFDLHVAVVASAGT